MPGWLAGWLVAWLAGWLVGRLAGWLAACLAGWLAGRLAGWLAGWLACWMAWGDDDDDYGGDSIDYDEFTFTTKKKMYKFI